MVRFALKSLLAGYLVMLGSAAAWAAPTVAQMLSPTLQPKQSGLNISTPTQEDYAGCEVKLVQGARGATGWLLLDAKKLPLRRFFDSNGDKKIDMWSFYKDGAEVYREVDSNGNEKADQFRWLHAGGSKWGVDVNEDGKIDAWRLISAEEVGQEAFEALSSRDFDRLKSLFITEAEIKALKLPAAKADKILDQLKKAQAKFDAVTVKQANLAKATFMRTESAVPACIPADELGLEQDLVTFESRSVIYETPDKKHDWLQTGEMIQVGMAWRLTDVPGPQQAGGGDLPVTSNPDQQKWLNALEALTKEAPPQLYTPKKDDKAAAYHAKRAGIIEQIASLAKADEKDNWYKQIFDNLSAAYQAGDETSLTKLTTIKGQTTKGSNLEAYATFREMWAPYAVKLSTTAAANLPKLQEEWCNSLSKFVQAYPKAEDTPDALLQLAMNAEFAGRDEESRRWYNQIHTNFPEHFLAEKAKGAEKRLGLVGREMELTGTTLSGEKFNLTQTKGKVTIVYYWTSQVGVCARDFGALKQLHSTLQAKGLELVTVSLDDAEADATKFLQTHQAPGFHLFQAGKDNHGLNSPLATQYGINSLPTLILIGRDGRVVNRTLQAADLEEAIKKAL